MTHRILWTSLPQVGLIAGCVWWLCFVPFRPERMLLPIPEDAVAVTAHAHLADRWPMLSTNPVTRGILLGFLAAGADDHPVLSSNEALQKSLRRLVPTDVVAAYVPGMDGVERGTWIFTSWLGGKGLWFRWAMTLARGKVERYGLSGGRTYWVMNTDTKPSNGLPLQFSFAFEEGLVVGCLSENPHSIRVALACHDRNHPSILSIEPRLIDWIMDAESEDRGWVCGGSKLPAVFPVRYELTELTDDRLSAIAHSSILLPSKCSPGKRARQPPIVEGLSNATLGITRDFLDVLFEGESGGGWSQGLRSFLEEVGANGAVIALLSGEYGGRIHSLRIPALVACIPCEGPAGVTAALRRVFRHLSVEYDISLMVTPSTDRDDPSVHSVTTARPSRYGDLAEEERAAYTVVDGWLIASSCRTTLIRLLDRREWAAKISKERDEEISPFWLEFDLASGGKSIRNALAAYSLLRAFGAADPPGWEWETLNNVHQWIEDLGTLGSFRVRTSIGDQDLIIQLKIAP